MRQVDWSAPENAPSKPALLGTKVWHDFPVEELLPYIDWNPFFQARLGDLAAWVGGRVCYVWRWPAGLRAPSALLFSKLAGQLQCCRH